MGIQKDWKLYYTKPASKTHPEAKYYVTKDGNVYVVKYNTLVKELTKVQCGHNREYLGCNIGGRTGPGRIYLHRLVYETFKGPIPKDMEIDHIDGNKHNNHIDNLRLVTPKENAMHRSKLGRHGQGVNKAILECITPTGEVIEAIGYDDLAAKIPVAVQTIYGAVCYGGEPKGYKIIRKGYKQEPIYGKEIK